MPPFVGDLIYDIFMPYRIRDITRQTQAKRCVPDPRLLLHAARSTDKTLHFAQNFFFSEAILKQILKCSTQQKKHKATFWSLLLLITEYYNGIHQQKLFPVYVEKESETVIFPYVKASIIENGSRRLRDRISKPTEAISDYIINRFHSDLLFLMLIRRISDKEPGKRFQYLLDNNPFLKKILQLSATENATRNISQEIEKNV